MDLRVFCHKHVLMPCLCYDSLMTGHRGVLFSVVYVTGMQTPGTCFLQRASSVQSASSKLTSLFCHEFGSNQNYDSQMIHPNQRVLLV